MATTFKTPDRTNDVPPPRTGTTRGCDCGKQMVARYDGSRERQGIGGWDWWCACGNTAPGGTWHPKTPEEHLQDAWEKANAQHDEVQRRAATPGRVIPPDCQHPNKTVADGGWTCDDCGRVGTIAALADHMRAMPPAWRRKWCDADPCDCQGCAAGKGGLRYWGFDKAKWQAWLADNPTAPELMADIEASANAAPDASPSDLVAAVTAKRPNVDAQQVASLAHAFVAARGVQQQIPTHQ